MCVWDVYVFEAFCDEEQVLFRMKEKKNWINAILVCGAVAFFVLAEQAQRYKCCNGPYRAWPAGNGTHVGHSHCSRFLPHKRSRLEDLDRKETTRTTSHW